MADTIDRIVRKEVSLGTIREKQQPSNHIGLATIAPFLDVATDDVIFEYLRGGLQEGLAPARAEDATAELSQKDALLAGVGSASIIDWSIADRYAPSDVTRWREAVFLQKLLEGQNTVAGPSFVGRTQDDFLARVARDDTRRRKMLDNRMEWLIFQALETSQIVYNDGKIKFTVDFGRPSDQTNQGRLVSGATEYDDPSGNFDPIGDDLAIQDLMYSRYGFRPKRCITSQKTLNMIWHANKFTANFVPIVGGTPNVPLDPNYLSEGYGPDAAVRLLSRQTGITYEAYDAFWRTRAIGSTTWTNNRFFSENKMLYLPTPADLAEVDDTEIGFAKTLTSPHPEGQWASGYYEWEQETVNPWNHVRGSGIKAFPVFPFMEYSYTKIAWT